MPASSSISVVASHSPTPPSTAPTKLSLNAGQVHLPRTGGAQRGRQWSLLIAGDWAPRLEHEHTITQDPLGFYHDLLPSIQAADLAVVNVECVLSDGGLQPIVKDGVCLSVPTNTVGGLSDIPFHLACLANNHIFDYGLEGLRTTRALLEARHIQTVGAGLNSEEAEQPRFCLIDDVRVAVVNVAEGEEARSTDGGPGAAGLDVPRLQAQLSLLRQQVDVVVAIAHAGREHLPVPPPHIRRIYRTLVDAGAQLVVGHHPHVAQGIELYKSTPIVYSLGNFAFLYSNAVEPRRVGYMVSVKFHGSAPYALEVLPYQIRPDGLTLLQAEQRSAFFMSLDRLSEIIVDDERLQAVWNAYADQWLLSQGLHEVANSAALLGGGALIGRSLLKAGLYRYKGSGLVRWLAQRRHVRPSLEATAGRNQAGEQPSQRGAPTRASLPRRSSSWRLAGESAARMKHGAAALRNRFDTISHRELYLTALQRVMAGTQGTAPDWAYQFLEDQLVFR